MAPQERLTRHQRRQQTRTRLLDAAAVVFARRGFHGATVEEIAAEGGFTQGALYANFEGKEGLFLALVDQRMAGQAAQVAAALGAGSPEGVQQGLRAHTEQQFRAGVETGFADLLLVTEFVLHAVRERPDLRAALVERFREADVFTAGLVRADREGEAGGEAPEGRAGGQVLSPEEVGLVQSALIHGLAMRMLLDPAALSPGDATRIIETVLARAAP